MDDLICVGCAKSFTTKKSLSAHEAQCSANKALTIDIYRAAKKPKKRKRTSPGHSPRHHHIARFSTPVDIEVADFQPEEPLPRASLAPTSPVPVVSGRSGRRIRLPARYIDYLPDELTGLRHAPPVPIPSSPLAGPSQPIHPPSDRFQTEPDSSGLFKAFPNRPTFEPRSDLGVVDAPTLVQGSLPSSPLTNIIPPADITRENLFSAFSSPTAGLLTCWHFSGSTAKTKEETNRLWKYIQDPSFNPSEQLAFSLDRECTLIKRYLQDESNPFRSQHGWIRSSFDFPVVKEGIKYASETDPTIPSIRIKNVIHRSITNIMKSVFADSVSSTFHMTPFEELWTTADGRNVRVYSEAYTSPRMLEAHEEINSLPRDPGDNYERVIAPLMIWSDATQLANFGDASLWPVYLFFGNQSKYTRGKPTAAACHHVAYIPSLPDDFQDLYTKIYGEASTGELYTHFKRELMQAIWRLLLDEEFVDAYRDGILIQCADRIVRRFFPRFFSYSADYPEKVLLSCIKFLGECPCPRCLVKKADVSQMGKPSDMLTRRTETRMNDKAYRVLIDKARRLIFKHGKKVTSKKVSDLLQEHSLVPTRNAFCERLSSEDAPLNFFLLFVVDLLHEFELGVWKAIFTHLMRILYAHGGNAVQELNWRYRKVGTFGRGTIRRFHKNASAMKRLAARDFEDLLQCAIPVFEGLLPSPHNEVILDLLFDLGTWHGFAKLRMHTDDTLSFFDTTTAHLSHAVQKFQATTCSIYQTTELPQECASRARRRAALVAKDSQRATGRENATTSMPKIKKLNLSTYKYHALADYPDTIRQYGTTDSYSTQMGELEHRRAKRRFPRSGKKKNIRNVSLAHQEAIERFIAKVNSARDSIVAAEASSQPKRPPRLRTSPTDHYHIAASTRQSHDLTEWLSEHGDDPAVNDFLPRLKDHLLGRIRGFVYNGDEYDFSDEDRRSVLILDNKIYEHAYLRVNYTTYDLRRDQDSVNPRSHPDIMLLSQEDERSHPYWYARVCLVFHAMVQHRNDAASLYSKPERMDVLFVRWFRRDSNFSSGWDAKRLPRLQFFDEENLADAFGFVDPDSVIRGVHLIPAFGWGLTEELLGPSFVRQEPETIELNNDWCFYYVNIFVDRDMFMRFRGGGIGHKVTREWDEFLQREGRDLPLDDEDISNDLESEDLADGLEGENGMDEDGAGVGEDLEADSGSDGEEDDIIVADEGEELDEDIWAQEGYGSL